MLHLRSYRREDLDALYRLDQSCFAPGIAYSRQELRYFLSRATALTFIAEETPEAQQIAQERQIAGFLIADLGRDASGHIITIDVAHEHRKRGVGRLLITAAEEQVLASGRQSMLLEVAVENAAAQSFYQQHGYLVLRRIADYYSTGKDALLMGKNL